MTRVLSIFAAAIASYAADVPKSWAADNGNGTYSNPLFYDEFSDADMIRVGRDYYLTGTTMHAMRYALFHYNVGGSPGGQADFDSFIVDEPRRRGLTKPIPYGQRIAFEDIGSGRALTLEDGKLQSAAGSPAAFKIVDRGSGRIALQTASGQYLSVANDGVRVTSAKPADAETFQWVDLQRGDTLLMSLATHRYILAPKAPGPVTADHPGPAPDRKDGSCFKWKVVK